MHDWKDLISGTFGCEDLQFAMHSLDRERAVAMLTRALDAKIGFAVYCGAMENWLRDTACRKGWKSQQLENLIATQMGCVRDLKTYFADDHDDVQ